MADYNIKLTVKYDGKAVTQGASQNSADLKKITSALQAAHTWGAKNAVAVKELQQSMHSQAESAGKATVANQNHAKSTTKSTPKAHAYAAAEKALIAEINQLITSVNKASQSQDALSVSMQKAANASNYATSAVSKQNAATKINQSVAEVSAQKNNVLAHSNHALANATNYASTALSKQNAATKINQSVTEVSAQKNNVLASSYQMLAGAVSLYAAASASVGFIKSASNAELLQLRLDNLTTSQAQNREAQRYLAETADRLNVRYNILADSYTRLLVLERQRTLSAKESRSILEGMTNVAKTLGASNVQVSQAMYGMTQAMTQGRVQAQELNQVVEPLPGLLQALDKAAGTTSGGFRRMVVDGEVTSQMFKTVLIAALKEYEGAAEKASGTISGATNDFLTSYDLLSKKLSAPINSAIVPFITLATDSLTLLGENIEILDTLADSLVAVSAVYAGRLAGSIASTISQKTADVAASNAQVAANQRSAASNVAVATTQLHYAQQIQQGATRQLAAARTDAARTVAVHNLAAANARLITAQRAATVATTQYTAASTAAMISTRGLSAAMALVGGPVGAAVIAALAIGYFMTSANDAGEETEQLSSRVETLTEKFKGLNAAGRALQIQKITDQEIKARENLIRLQERLTEAENAPGEIGAPSGVNDFNDSTMQNAKSLQKLREDVNEANALLDSLAKQKQELFNSTVPTNWLEVESNNATDTSKYDKDISDLETYLGGQEAKISAAYVKRQTMLDKAYASQSISQQKYNELSLQLDLKRETELTDLAEKQERQRLDDAERAQKDMERTQQEHYDTLIRQLYGYVDKEAQIKAENQARYNQEVRQQEVLQAQGYRNEEHRRNVQHEQQLLDIKFQNAATYRQFIVGQQEWEIKTEEEKRDHFINVGEYTFKQLAGQSKKAFAMYKAFAITKAVINTYEMATGAYNAMASIPYVGPVLGAAAAAAAIAYGIGQVNAIKNQEYSAAYHGGVDYVPFEQTALLQQGERVVSPRQNVALSAATDKINKGELSAGNSLAFYFNPQINLSDTSDAALSKTEAWLFQMFERFELSLINKMNTGTGDFTTAVRRAAA